MLLLSDLSTAALARLHAVFSVSSPYGPAALGGALIFSLLFYIDARRRRRSRISLAGFFKAVFPLSIVLHPSSRLDMRLWVINTIALASGYGMLAISGLACRNATLTVLVGLLGSHEPTVWPIFFVLTLTTLVELLAYEFGYWASHYAFHAFPMLWEFHKVHHSAEVLTAMTEMREHPVEIIVFMNVIGVMTGCVFGALTYVFGPGAHPLTLFNANIALMGFLVTVGHLRHTHMWIAFKGLSGRLFQSPAHHQIHHSDQPKHFNKNLGFSLAVWDWLFGTLYVPEKYEKITFGVGADHVDFDTVSKIFALPFLRAAQHIARAGVFWLPDATPQPVGEPIVCAEAEANSEIATVVSP
jgi:sterol desaturase/sphingolipid hydroxylase (fatty acid hydroxylase superfamily)